MGKERWLIQSNNWKKFVAWNKNVIGLGSWYLVANSLETYEVLELGQWAKEAPVSLNRINSSSLRWQPWAITVCESWIIIHNSVYTFVQKCLWVQVRICPRVYFVSEQVSLVIDVCVRHWFRKQLLYKIHFLCIFTDVTLKTHRSRHYNFLRIRGVTFPVAFISWGVAVQLQANY